jgi:hypothetical protein
MRTVAALVALSLPALLFSRADALAGHRGQVFINRGFVAQDFAIQRRPVIVPRSRTIIIERPFPRRHFFVDRPIFLDGPIIIQRRFIVPRREIFVSPSCPFP